MKQVSTLLCLLVCVVLSGYAQSSTSETHDMITYDTTVAYYNQPQNTWYLRITRPRNLFTAGSPDTASRPAIITMPGIGEVGSDPSYLTRYGPHYWLQNGWDGSVQLGNGTHYPIIITVVQGVVSTSPYYLSALMDQLKQWYHIKQRGVHVAGLSMGAFEWGDLICFSAYSGDEHAMSGITSYVGLSGEGSTYDGNNFGFNYPGFQAYTVWAQKYGGHFWGMQGNMDERYDWNVRDAVNAGVPNSGYFAYTQDGGGAHCCWNDEYNPSQHDWQCVGQVTNTNIVNSTYPNSMGSYIEGSNLYQWMLRQGDTSMAGSTTAVTKPTPTANAGTNQTITLPTSSVTLSGSGSESGGSITSYAWSETGGPSTATISNASVSNPTVSNLVAGTYTFQLTVTDSYGTQATSTMTVTVNPAATSSQPVSSGYQAVPGTIQAESYVSSVGVKTETTTDVGGGLDVGYIYQGDGMTYNINVGTAGSYTLSLRVASPLSGGVINVVNGSGAVIATVNVPNTGGWQVWTTVTTTVTLPAGQQAFSLQSPASPNWNINWFNLTQVVLPTPTANAGTNQTITLPTSSTSLSGSGAESGGTIASYAWSETGGPSTATISNTAVANPTVSNLVAGTYNFQLTVTDSYGTQATATMTVTVNAATSSSSTSGYQAVPGTIQAESYVSSVGVKTEPTTDAGGGLDVGYIYQGDGMTYNINVASAGTYTMSLRVASPLNGAVINVLNGSGTVLATVNVPNTGGWQAWTTVTTTVTLSAGQQSFSLQSPASPNWNINWFSFVLAGSSSSGSAFAIPGTIQAENYSAMNNVQNEATSDAGGGQDVGYISQGSWMSYPVNVATAGSYTFTFRVATAYNGAGFQVQDGSGNILATVAMNNTGGWQNWINVTATVNLAAGQQTIKLVSVSQAGWNINWFSAATNSYSGGYPIPGTVQAENYINKSSSPQTETTLDNGGGLDVGWINQGDWLDYAVNVASAGTYTLSFRIAAAYTGASFAVQDGFGNVYTTVNLPQTWSYQAWVTVTASVQLSSGPQIIRLTSTSATNWNINWFSGVQTYAVAGSAVSGAVTTAAASSLSLDSGTSMGAAIQLYPNPVRDAFQLAIDNTFTGKVTVQILTPSGAAVKSFELNKELIDQQWQLSISDLPAGVYMARIVSESWQETRKLIKL